MNVAAKHAGAREGDFDSVFHGEKRVGAGFFGVQIAESGPRVEAKAKVAPPVRYNVLWVPSQKGALPVCLHWQSQASPSFSAVNFFGAKDVPLWLPSQNGWEADLPQAQNQ
jgi:hypothetical protein